MPRAIWKGAITFGLVHVPVELYPAEERREFKFSMLDKRDFSPVGYKRYSKKTGKEVEWSDVVKGYEYEKDQYVVLSDEDFRRANVKASQTIEIETFVPAAEVPPQFYETPYYLVPTKSGEKVYALLRETLRSTGRVAIAQVVIRTTQHLALVAPSGRLLMLITLRYPDELRDTKGLSLPAEGLKEIVCPVLIVRPKWTEPDTTVWFLMPAVHVLALHARGRGGAANTALISRPW